MITGTVLIVVNISVDTEDKLNELKQLIKARLGLLDGIDSIESIEEDDIVDDGEEDTQV